MSTPTPEALHRIYTVMSFWEHRPDHVYDEQDPAHWIMPDSSMVGSFDRAFLGAAGRALFALMERV